MSNHKNGHEGCWVSLVLRIAVISLFGAAGISKFVGGNLENIVTYFQETFRQTWLPMSLVTTHARIVPYIEIAIPLWLMVGFRLKWAWMVTSLYTVTLAFGMMVAKQYAVAADNFFYVFMCCAGLYFSQFDCVNLDGPRNKECCKA